MKALPLRFLPLWCLVLCGGLAAPAVSAGGLREFLLPGNELEAITVTDFTPQGRLRRLPSPGAPVYYAAISAGYRDFGGIMAGERPIPREVVNQTMLKVLAQQGYLPVAPDQRPEILLLWTWGTLNVEHFSGAANGLAVQLNEHQMLRFLGGDKLGLTSAHHAAFPEQTLAPGLFYSDGDARNLIDTARDNLYVAVIAAYEVDLNERNRGVLLWNTRISCPARGFWLPEALPPMLAMAGSYIGRETSRPVWIRATEEFVPEVKLGDLKLVRYLESSQPTVIEAGPSR